MGSIVLNHIINGSLLDATQVKLRDSTGTYGIKETVSGTVVVPPTGAIASTSQGIYEYNIDALTVGKQYTATWEIYYPNLSVTPQYTTEIFYLDADITLVDGVTLADIEWELASRTGPHYKFTVGTNTGQTVNQVYLDEIKTRLPVKNLADLYVLRRGFLDTPNNPYITNFNVGDRIRRISEYTPSTGFFTTDRDYISAVQQHEILEFMYFDPTKIREAVLHGLKRAKVNDVITITTTSVTSERNLTASAGWLVRQSQVQDIKVHPAPQIRSYPHDVNWTNYSLRQGDLYVYLYPDPFPMSIEVHALRPTFTMVNGQTALSGPNDDLDIITVDLDYAAAAAHVELWRRNAAELQSAAQLGYQVTKKEAANTFSMLAMMYVIRRPQKVRQSFPGGFYSPFRTQDVISIP